MMDEMEKEIREKQKKLGKYDLPEFYLLKIIDRLRTDIERASTYKGIEAYACPLCIYKNGKFVERCQMHKEIDRQRAEMEKVREVSEPMITRYKNWYAGSHHDSDPALTSVGDLRKLAEIIGREK